MNNLNDSATVAIVGRPNVGKSALFNRISGKKISIVDETVGVTRDRIFSECVWLKFKFTLIDTGGIELKKNINKNNFLNEIISQTEISIEQANVIVFVVDLKCGITSVDLHIAALLHKTKKNVIVCVNKCDSIGKLPNEFYEFYGLGFSNVFAVSAIHGYGLGDFLDCVTNNFSKNKTEKITKKTDEIKIALVGRPNVGKSSILNKLFGSKRAIVSHLAGTTRDSIDVKIKINNKNFILIDTAGLVRKSTKVSNVEHYSLLRTYMAIEKSDVCVIVLDVVEGLTELDLKIASYVHKALKGSLVFINKIDLIENKEYVIKNFDLKLKSFFNFMPYIKHFYVSAKTGFKLNKIFEIANLIYEQRNKKIATSTLNNFINFCVSRVPPSNFKNGKLKIYYVTQTDFCPPTFTFFVNDCLHFHFSYKRYLENQLRLEFGFFGTPIKFIIKKSKKIKN